MIRTRLLAASAFLLLAAPAMGQITAPAAGTSASVSVAPRILSDADVARYRQIFAAERAGQFAKSETLQAELTDPVLIGYVKAAHYLSSKSGRTPMPDLIAWLKQYPDLGVADDVYKLAVLHSTTTVKKGKKRVTVAVVTNIPAPSSTGLRSGGYEEGDLPDPQPDGAAARAVQPGIEAAIKAGQPDQAMALLTSLQPSAVQTAAASMQAAAVPVPSSLPAASGRDIACLSQRVAASYLAEAMPQQAFDVAARVPDADRAAVPMLDWSAGFAAYRLGRYADAAAYLERLEQARGINNWTRAQAAFWAARAHLAMGDPQRYVTLLGFAARDEPTFYGLLAERVLGEDSQAGFSDPVLDAASFDRLMQVGGARRAVALAQVGETDTVGFELNRAFVGNTVPALDPGYAALSRALGIPNLELRASEKSAEAGVKLTGLFPIPPYRPETGYALDPSLVLAFARIESRFQQQATSPVGAQGIMQIMPATARHLAGGGDSNLSDPSVSLALGQKYIAQLLDSQGNSLVATAASYNAGPGNVGRWIATRGGDMRDPLLFIESIPSAETRSYVKKILVYHWMYRRRMGQEASSLNEAAAGGWPNYHPADFVRPAAPSPTAPSAPAASPPVIDDAGPTS